MEQKTNSYLFAEDYLKQGLKEEKEGNKEKAADLFAAACDRADDQRSRIYTEAWIHFTKNTTGENKFPPPMVPFVFP